VYSELSEWVVKRTRHFSNTVNAITDGRQNPTVPIAVIFKAMFLGEFTNDEASYGSATLW
jgi:hypothetical protein